MKNLKTIIIGIFAAISLTEISHPIIFTGPVRRNAHREQEEQAFAVGLAAGAHRNNEDDQESNNNESNNENQESNEVQTQSFGEGQFLNQLSPDQKAKLKKRFSGSGDSGDSGNSSEKKDMIRKKIMEKLAASDSDSNDDVTTQSIPLDNEPSPAELPHADLVAAQESAQEPTLLAAPEQDSKEPEVSNVQESAAIEEQVVDEPVHLPSIQEPAALELSSDEHADLPAVEEPKSAQVETSVPVAQKAEEVVEQPTQPEADLVHAVEVSSSFAQATHAVEPVVEHVVEQKQEIVQPVAQPVEQAQQVKIVKVYPVYDAVRSAARSVQAAGQDMINYLHSLIFKK